MTYEGGGGDENLLCSFAGGSFGLGVRAVVSTLGANWMEGRRPSGKETAEPAIAYESRGLAGGFVSSAAAVCTETEELLRLGADDLGKGGEGSMVLFGD